MHITLRDLKNELSFKDMMDHHDALDLLEDADDEARQSAERDAEARRAAR